MHSKFNIVAPDQGLAAALQHKIDQKTKPRGAAPERQGQEEGRSGHWGTSTRDASILPR